MSADLQQLLSGPDGAQFRAYVSKSLCTESLEFYEAVEFFRQISNDDDRRTTAKTIYDTYVKVGSDQEINVDYEMRVAIQKGLNEAQNSLFDEAQAEVRSLLVMDVIPKYHHSYVTLLFNFQLIRRFLDYSNQNKRHSDLVFIPSAWSPRKDLVVIPCPLRVRRHVPSGGSPCNTGEPEITDSSRSSETSTPKSCSLDLPDSYDSRSGGLKLDEKVANASDLGAVLFEVEASKTIDVLNAPVPLTLDNYLRKTKEFIPTATSVSMSYAVYMMNGIILLMFVGRLGEAPGAAAGLANFYIAVTGVAFCSGLLAAEDTLCSQAFGAGSLERVSIIFQRSVAVMLAICIPVGLLWCFTEPLLLALHQDPEVAKLAGHFVLIYLPSLPAFLVNDALKRYLVSQGVASPTMYSTLIANIVSTSIGYFFVLHTPLKFYGMPIAMALANVLQLLVLVFWTISQKLHVPTWRRITMPELLDWKENVEFVKLGIPGALMLCAEWIGFEIHGLMSGWIGVTSLAAQSILINTNYFFFSFPLGMGVATTVMVGNEMGSGRYTEAWLSYLVNFINVEILAVLVSIILFSAHSVWGYIFTNVPEVIVLVAKTLPFMALFVCSDAAGGLGGGAIRGVGQQTKAAIVNLIAFYAIGVPAGYFFAFPIGLNWGLPGLWAGLACASYTAAFLIHLILWTGDWKQWAIKAQELAQTDSPMAPAEKVSLSDIKKLASDDFSSDQNGHVEIDSFSSNKSEDHSLDSNFAAIGEKSELDDTEAVKLDF